MIRKLGDERGYTMKQKIDKWLEYSTWLRNMCSFTFVHIVHMNRGLANIERIKYAGEFIYPTGDDIKDFKLNKIVGYLNIIYYLCLKYKNYGKEVKFRYSI